MSLSCALAVMGCIEFNPDLVNELPDSSDNIKRDSSKSSSDSTSSNTSEDSSKQSPSAPTSKNNKAKKTTPEPEFPSGSFMMISTLKQGSKTNSLPTTSGTIRWNSTNYGVIGYFPELKKTKLFTQTSSKSYAKSYVYGLTRNKKLYTVRTGTETYSKDIKEIDPKTGRTKSSCFFTSNDTYKGFTIVGKSVYYKSKIRENLFGKRTSGGDLMKLSWPCSGKGKKALEYKLASGQEFIGAGDKLFSTITSKGKTAIFEWNTTTMQPNLRTTVSSGEKFGVEIFGGDDGLYWKDSISIYRLPLSGEPEQLFDLPGRIATRVEIDASHDHVFVAYKTYKPEFYLYNLKTSQEIPMDIDDSVYSSSILGNGQFLILD